MVKKKFCKDCLTEKPARAFSKRHKEKDWLHTYCRLCMSKRSTKWRKQNREKFNEYQRNYLKNKRQLDLKSGK